MSEHYDVIIAGGGTAGCVIAGRLAAADPNLRILIVEQGPDTKDDLAHIQPAIFARHLVPDTKTIRFVVSKPSPALDGRATIVPTGQCVGGGSSVNFMLYTRGSASDYDDWEIKHGNPGWGFEGMLPYFKKAETYLVQQGQITHGYSGPLKVSRGGIYSNVGEAFLDVGANYDSGREYTHDTNDFKTINKYAHWSKWINGDSGHRSDAAHNYIYNLEDNRNLVVKSGYIVKRVVFEETRAVGIEYLPDARFRPDEPLSVTTAFASRQVIISAGSMGSPLILERSGLGGEKLLKQLGIPVVADLSGVGERYEDHCGVHPPYFASDESLTLDKLIIGDPAEIQRWTPEWSEKGSGLMANNGADAGLKLRPSTEELKAIGPQFTERWNEHFADAPDKPAMFFGSLAMLTGLPTPETPLRRYFSCIFNVSYPASSGHLHITSGDDVNAPPDFDAGFLSKPEDLALLRWGYKRSREFARRMRCYRGEYTAWHPKFPPGSEAECKADTMQVSMDAPDIKWTQEDDKIIDQYVKEYVTTSWHALGTCPMKPREKGGVVDTRLNVYGVQGLKVADLSIAPSNVAANTYSTALAIAEKAAVIIGEELGIKA
ncbi:hypothetical protein EIP91_009421 [Steccherinum ochraceum]|uniref:Glucose-methanol-choline oxidoreductase N-terminal domain-containing protein n=1 Tax=Steccherinum ochraceum TaxID=92696 RepID=A0A4R0R1M8_9APHY|nr:hypothetical protein EIP91_009421 [Steccherinum ochraceum]